jgi:hypothetical protein
VSSARRAPIEWGRRLCLVGLGGLWACVSLDGLTSSDAATGDDASDAATTDATSQDATQVDGIAFETGPVADVAVPEAESPDGSIGDGGAPCEGSGCTCGAATADACVACCESVDLTATEAYLTRVWEDCACPAFVCFTQCSQACATPPSFNSACISCLQGYAASPGCDAAVNHCRQDPSCESLVQCIGQCP